MQLQWPDGEKNPLGGNSLTPFGLSVEEWQSMQVSDYPTVEYLWFTYFSVGQYAQ